MNVLVYSGPEVISASLTHAITSLRSLLLPNYTVQAITSQSLANHPWSATCALIVFPSCLSTPSSVKAMQMMKTYVDSGGAYLGLSSGARVTERGSTSGGMLRFDDKATGTTIYPTFRSSSEPVVVELSPLEDWKSTKKIYQDGVSEFVGNVSHVKTLSRYTNGSIAGFTYYCQSGGRLALLSPSIEYPLSEWPVTLSPEDLHETEQYRLTLLRDTLRALSLCLPEDRPPSCPLPQFLVAPPLRRDIVPRILAALQLDLNSAAALFEDTNDTFHFHHFSSGLKALHEARVRSVEPTQQMKEEEWQPKHIIVCASEPENRPTIEHTPLLNVDRFFASLEYARRKEGLDERDGDSWGMGEVLLYGEVVTSTQTMLDKNPRLLHALPTPLLSLAAIQLTGRGRGGNTWLSPRGSLPISLLLRVPFSLVPAPKLVFIQYLFSLAVTEACRDERVLGKLGERVRIKWPNDVYVEDGVGEVRKKVGGILVNTSFGSGGVEVVIGSGLNVTNALPTTSIAQLIPPGVDRKLSMENTAAVILAKFEAMWKTFIAHDGSFEPFMDLYLERWLHSDQVVTVTSVSPPQVVRICGITLDHGLLRTIPERSGFGGMGGMQYIDLQPDGNSFDLMQGLIKTKTYT